MPPTSLRCPEARDLAWLLEGPSLLEGKVLDDAWGARERARLAPRYRELDRDPAPLLAYLGERVRTPLLGHYFEALTSFWVKEFLKPEVFHWRLPVLRGREVAGEADLLFRKDGRVTHWETAVKFYLCAARNQEEALDPRFYLGTMLRDRLDLKTERLFSHQLRIFETPEGRARLLELGLGEVVESAAWFKGRLFYPAFEDWREHPHPAGVSPSHERGWWLSMDQLPEFLARKERSRWKILTRRQWLSRLSVAPNEETLDAARVKAEAESHFSEHVKALMLSELIFKEEQSGWEEVSRGTLVGVNWLSRARDTLSRDSK